MHDDHETPETPELSEAPEAPEAPETDAPLPFVSIQDVLRSTRRPPPEGIDTSPLPSVAELVACRPTDLALQIEEAALRTVRSCPLDHPQRAEAERMAGRAAALVKLARARDRAIDRRRALGPDYAACFCLGQGGGGERLVVGLPIQGGGMITAYDDDGVEVLTWRRKCPCPDGAALQERIAVAAARAYERYRAARVARVAGDAGLSPVLARLTRAGWLHEVGARAGDLRAAESALRAIEVWQVLMGVVGEPSAGDPPTTTGERHVLLLAGGYGTGKTSLATLVALDWIRAERSVVFRSAATLALEFREAPRWRSTDDDRPLASELLAAYVSAGLLVLDDLGTEAIGDGFGDRWRETLFLLLEGRANAGLPTVVPTNLTPDELEARYGKRLRDRLEHPVHVVRVLLATPNLREAPLP